MQTPSEDTFWQFDIAHWYHTLGSSADGLTQQAASAKFRTVGHSKKSDSRLIRDLKLFIGQFKSPLMLLLIGAVLLSAFLGETSDVVIILFIVIATGTLSFVQERNAGRVVEKLQHLISLKSAVKRGGALQTIPSSKIVPGDILIVQAGDMIPADCLIIDSNELNVNEASLTGESYPVRKEAGIVDEQTEISKRTNCLWKGTNIVSGNATALVIRIGDKTIFGSIAQSALRSNETTFEKGIKDFGFFLMRITLVLSVAILVINLLNHKSPIESALFALALAVGMAPELLPAITTIAMSAGAKRMLEKKVIVKKLSSIQNLGEVDVLCTDKTGTITEGVIKVYGLLDYAGKVSEYVKQLGYWNASLESGYANPIDDALKQLTIDSSLTAVKSGEIPYDFLRKRLSIAVKTPTEHLLITKGAFTQIMGICTGVRIDATTVEPINSHAEALQKRFEKFGDDGYRAIGICYKLLTQETITREDEAEMVFAGFIVLEDPVKSGILETIQELQQLQVQLKIITGDNKNVAQATARKVGVENPIVLTGSEILHSSNEALQHLVCKTQIFAEVEPQQKERIIFALRKSFTVAYMGDGINDVSAINAADVGISVDNAVDVAQESADFVLMEKSLMVIVDGIKEGRKTFSNTLKYIYISTGSTFGNMFSVAMASLLLPFLPMLPTQILLLNFITDFPYLTVASDNVDAEQLEKPGKWNIKTIRAYMVVFGIHSSLFDGITFFTLMYILNVRESTFQTGWFVESILTELCILFVIRTHKNFFKSQPGKYLYILSAIGAVLAIAVPYLPFASAIGLVPLPMSILAMMIVIVILYVITADILKVWFFKRYSKV